MVLAEDATLTTILQTHAVNMEAAGKCSARHHAIVEALETLRETVNERVE
jgi:hypothetical protein